MMKKILVLLLAFFVLPIPVFVAARATQEPLRLPIVMYHQLTTRPGRAGAYTLTLDQFECDLQYLRAAGYESITLRELLDWSDGLCELPEKPMMITFDDGYETTGVWAAPLLEQYGFTGLMAVVGSVAQHYTDTPDHTLAYSHHDWEAVAAVSRGETLEVQSHTWDMHELGARRGCSRMLGEENLTYRATLTADLARFEEIAALNGVKTVPGIAFPYGLYCDETIAIVRDMGYRAAFTCNEYVNRLTRDPDELLALARFNRPAGRTSEQFFAVWG